MNRKTALIYARVMNSVRQDVHEIRKQKHNRYAKQLVTDLLYNVDVALYVADTGDKNINPVPLCVYEK